VTLLPEWGAVTSRRPKGTFFAEARHRTCRSLRSVHPFLHSSPFYHIPQNHLLCDGPDTPLKSFPSTGASAPSSNILFLGSTRRSIPNGIWIGSAGFAQLTAERRYTLQWANPSPSKLLFRMGNLEPHPIHDYLGPPSFSTQNGISVGSAVLQGSRL